MNRTTIFLGASFISTVGDIVLVTALPFGLGHEFGRIEWSVIAWLVPAVAVFGASFMARSVAKRHNSARTDYAWLLFSVAVLEIIISILSLIFEGPIPSLILTVCFLIGYAFIKEGVPRLLYQVTMYRFFVPESEYKKLVGVKAGLDLVGMLTGMLIAAKLVSSKSWRWALPADALTFVIFGAVLMWAGKDFVIDSNAKLSHESRHLDSKDIQCLRWNLAIVPFLHALNALFPNYFPMISEKLGFMNIGSSILAIAVLRLPGLLMGLFYSRISVKFPPHFWVHFLPVCYLGVALLFIAIPSSLSMALMVFFGGLNTGIFSPSDVMVRSRLSGHDLVHFNTLALRWLAVFQFFACCLAILFFSSGQFQRLSTVVALAAFGVAAAMVQRFHRNTIIKSHGPA